MKEDTGTCSLASLTEQKEKGICLARFRSPCCYLHKRLPSVVAFGAMRAPGAVVFSVLFTAVTVVILVVSTVLLLI